MSKSSKETNDDTAAGTVWWVDSVHSFIVVWSSVSAPEAPGEWQRRVLHGCQRHGIVRVAQCYVWVSRLRNVLSQGCGNAVLWQQLRVIN